MATTDWNPLLRSEFDKPYWRDLQDYVALERSRTTVFPPAEQVFSALLCSLLSPCFCFRM